MKKKIIPFIFLLVAAGIAFGFFKASKKENTPELFTVTYGSIVQGISESGTVKPAKEITLGFEIGGKIERIFVQQGQEVQAGQTLVRLDSSELRVQLLEAEAARQTAQAKLDKLLAGASDEEIQLAETNLLNAQTALSDAEQNLEDTKALAEKKLSENYDEALNTLDNAYLQLYNAGNTVALIQRLYFYTREQESIKVQQAKGEIKDEISRVGPLIEEAKTDSSPEKIDPALNELKKALEIAKDNLEIVRDMCEEPQYRDQVSSSYKTSLDAQKANIIDAMSSISDIEQAIALTKTENESDINTAEAKVNTARGQVQKAQDELILKKAAPRQVEVDLYQSQVKQAEARVELLMTQIANYSLQAPMQGVITDIARKVGEIIKATESVVTLISSKPFQIKVDIYEEDIGRVRPGQEVSISLVAFPQESLTGRVATIDPAEKLIDGVVYYEVTVDFDSLPGGESVAERLNLKPGMTADIVIKTASRENVLIVPERALIKKGQENFVKVFKKQGELEERKVEIGLKGTDDMVEVLSGLAQGEEIVIQ